MQKDDTPVTDEDGNNKPTDTQCKCPTFQVAAQTGTRYHKIPNFALLKSIIKQFA